METIAVGGAYIYIYMGRLINIPGPQVTKGIFPV